MQARNNPTLTLPSREGKKALRRGEWYKATTYKEALRFVLWASFFVYIRHKVSYY